MPESVSEFLTRLGLAPTPATLEPPPVAEPVEKLGKPMAFDEKPVVLTFADARIPERYRAAKAEAVARGVGIVVLDEEEAPPPTGTMILRRDISPDGYRKARDAALATGRDWRFEEYTEGT